MCSLLLAAKSHNFGQILTFCGLLYGPPFTNEGQILCPVADPRTFTCEISSRSVYSVVLWLRKAPIFAIFELRHLVMSLTGSSLRKLNTGAQLQTFPYPTVSKSFLYSNAFMAKSGAQSLTFKSVTNKQTNRQTSKKFNVFGCPNTTLPYMRTGVIDIHRENRYHTPISCQSAV